MFARLLGQSGATISLFGRSPKPARPSFAIPRPHLTDEQLDHLLTYWASGKPQVTSATVKAQLFLDHLRIKLVTDAKFEQALRSTVGKTAFRQTAATSIVTILVDAAHTALKNARPDPSAIPSDGRYGVGLKAFDQELCDALKAIDDKQTLLAMRKTGFERVRSLMTDALKRTAHETHLADQLRDTARNIRAMEELQDAGTLPPEDVYELKLRRELFIADHAMYVKITRAAVEQVRLLARTMTMPGQDVPANTHQPRHVLSQIFGSVAIAAKSAFDLIRDITGNRTYN